MEAKAVVRRCNSMLDGLDVPSPLDVDKLLRRVSQRSGRPVTLVPRHAPLGLCGMWVALPDHDVVYYESATSRVHREHIILHEVGHILCDHRPRSSPDLGSLQQLIPNLDPAMVSRVMGRSRYTEPEEREAEVMASLIMERAGGAFASTPRAGVSTPDDTVLSRLGDALGDRADG